MKVIVLRYSEIFLKGRNKSFFESALIRNVRHALQDFNCQLTKISKRYIVSGYNEQDEGAIMTALCKVFGLYSISTAYMVKSDLEEISNACISLAKNSGTFKIETNRADKTFPLNSLEISAKIGGILLAANKNIKVDVHNPQWTIYIDVREDKHSLCYTQSVRCVNGMPVGTGGKGILLLSGGIDSPVAGYMMAKRGMSIRALHFESHPFTSVKAKEKVLKLAKILKEYCINITVDVVNVADIQKAIHANCPESYMITLLRRFMVRIATQIAKKHKASALITGESLGQVASQTVESLASSASVTDMLILRPLIAFDKDEIVEVAKRIGTFETSIEPYEDCCTVFLPKNPLIHPILKEVEREESKLDIELLINDALLKVECISI